MNYDPQKTPKMIHEIIGKPDVVIKGIQGDVDIVYGEGAPVAPEETNGPESESGFAVRRGNRDTE